MIIFFAISCTGIGSVKNKPLDKQQTFMIKKNALITHSAEDLLLFILFAEWDEKDLMDFMVSKKRFIVTTDEIEIIILEYVEDPEDKNLDMFYVKVKQVDLRFWVLRYNIKVNGEKDDKTKRRTPKRQEDKREDIKERKQGGDVRA